MLFNNIKTKRNQLTIEKHVQIIYFLRIERYKINLYACIRDDHSGKFKQRFHIVYSFEIFVDYYLLNDLDRLFDVITVVLGNQMQMIVMDVLVDKNLYVMYAHLSSKVYPVDVNSH